MLGLPSLFSVLTALAIAIGLGALVGRMATQWFSGRGLSNVLTETRGAFLPFLMAPVVYELTHFKTWLVVGIVIGFMQAISVGRWIARRTGEWSPSLLGGLALGRSRAALLSARTMSRGAVVGTLAATTTQVVLLEALLQAVALPGLRPQNTIGAALYQGAGASALFLLLLGAGCIFGTELLMSWIFQRRASVGAKTNSPAQSPHS